MSEHQPEEDVTETPEPSGAAAAPEAAGDTLEAAGELLESTPEAAEAAAPGEAGESAEAAESEEEGPETLAVPVAELRPALEAVLMVADQPLDQVTLASAVGYPVEEVVAALTGLAQEYAEQGRGFDLRNVAGGWRYYTREEYAAVVEKFVLDGQQARLTQAALETLAVVAYKQPVSRARVSAVRGVNVDGVMRTLLARGLVEECGHDAETSAVLYRTTSYFLERIGVTSIDELPELAPFLPDMGELDDLEETVSTSGARTANSGVADAPSAPEAAQASESTGSWPRPSETPPSESPEAPPADEAPASRES